MNFASLSEFFVKLANWCYLLVLLPLGVFIYIYHQLETDRLHAFITNEDEVNAVIAVILLLVLVNLTSVHLLSRKRLKNYVTEIGLGRKLDRYAEIVLFRMKSCAASSLLAAVGLLLTDTPWFGFSFIAILGWTIVQWPTSTRACRDLQLKGDEYEMVFYKKDKF